MEEKERDQFFCEREWAFVVDDKFYNLVKTALSSVFNGFCCESIRSSVFIAKLRNICETEHFHKESRVTSSVLYFQPCLVKTTLPNHNQAYFSVGGNKWNTTFTNSQAKEINRLCLKSLLSLLSQSHRSHISIRNLIMSHGTKLCIHPPSLIEDSNQDLLLPQYHKIQHCEKVFDSFLIFYFLHISCNHWQQPLNG